MKRMLIALALCACAFGQTEVRLSDKPAASGTESLFYRDGSNNSEYICVADSPSLTSTFAVTASSSNQPRTSISVANITNIVDAANTSTVTTSQAHGLRVGGYITIEGATVDTDLNGTYRIETVGSTTTFTITTASVSDATYTDATMKFSTTQPRSNSNVWSVQKFVFTTTYVDRIYWLKGAPAGNLSCDSRTAY
jgi:hypothetical protein